MYFLLRSEKSPLPGSLWYISLLVSFWRLKRQFSLLPFVFLRLPPPPFITEPHHPECDDAIENHPPRLRERELNHEIVDHQIRHEPFMLVAPFHDAPSTFREALQTLHISSASLMALMKNLAPIHTANSKMNRHTSPVINCTK